jgi:hypothetical protein
MSWYLGSRTIFSSADSRACNRSIVESSVFVVTLLRAEVELQYASVQCEGFGDRGYGARQWLYVMKNMIMRCKEIEIWDMRLKDDLGK